MISGENLSVANVLQKKDAVDGKNSNTNVSLTELIRDIALILFHGKTEQNMFLVVCQQNLA